jgi:sugar phosphate isomerase/epimerase
MFFHSLIMKTAHPKHAAPRLVMCATLWSLEGHPSARREWSLERKLRAIKAAGFDGLHEMNRPGVSPWARRLGLRVCGRVFTRDARDAESLIATEAAGGARLLDVMLGRHDTTPAQAVRLIRKVIRLARKHGCEAYIETHRDTCTETPEKLAEIARLYARATAERLPLTWDHSHLAVSKHVLPGDYAARLLEHPELIQHSRLFHCRPFNSQHCQVPVTNGRGRLTPEFRDYLGFAEELFAVWLGGPRPRGELWVCPELGTSVGYNVSTNPPVWPDTIRCRRELAGAWRRALARA